MLRLFRRTRTLVGMVNTLSVLSRWQLTPAVALNQIEILFQETGSHGNCDQPNKYQLLSTRRMQAMSWPTDWQSAAQRPGTPVGEHPRASPEMPQLIYTRTALKKTAVQRHPNRPLAYEPLQREILCKPNVSYILAPPHLDLPPVMVVPGL